MVINLLTSGGAKGGFNSILSLVANRRHLPNLTSARRMTKANLTLRGDEVVIVELP